MARSFKHLFKQAGQETILRGNELKKLWKRVVGGHKLSPKAKDRLALLAGFQSWQDLDEALHGKVDASINYDSKG